MAIINHAGLEGVTSVDLYFPDQGSLASPIAVVRMLNLDTQIKVIKKYKLVEIKEQTDEHAQRFIDHDEA